MAKRIVETELNAEALSPLDIAIAETFTILNFTHNLLFPERSPGALEEVFLKPLVTMKEIDSHELRSRVPEAVALKYNTDGTRISAADREATSRLVAFYVACAFFVKARFFARSSDESWKYLLDAKYFLGYLSGRVAVRTISAMSQAGTDRAHKTNRENKAKVFVWLDANRAKYKSMDSTADAIAGKVVHVSWRTAREWIGEWKKIRSAGTP